MNKDSLFMDGSIGRGLEDYLIAMAAVAVAAIATALLWPLPQTSPLAFFYAAVAVAAWRGGAGPRLAATLVSALVGAYFFIPPYHALPLAARAASPVIVFLGVATFIGWLIGARRASTGEERTGRPWFEEFVDRVAEGAATTDASGRIALLNPMAERLTGWTAAEARGKPAGEVFQIVDERTGERRDPVAEALAAGGACKPLADSILISRTGVDVPISGTVAPAPGRPGDPAGVVLIIRDTPQRRLNQEAPRRGGELNRQIIVAGDYCLKLLDLDGRIQMINKHGAQLLEMDDPDGWVGRSLIDAWPEESRAALRDAIGKAAGGERARFGGFAPTVKGTPKWWDVTIAPIIGASGRAERLICIGHDVTERKRTEDALRASQERYRALFNSIDEGFCVIDMIFDDQGRPVDFRYLEVNPAFEALTGLAGVVGRTLRELVSDDMGDWDGWRRIYGRVALTGEPVRFANLRPILDERWFDLYAFRLGDGESRKVAVLFTNISAIVRAERERARLVRGLESSRAEMVRIIEHAPAFVCILRGPNHVHEVVNARVYELVGQRALIGRTVAEATPEALAQGYVDILDRVYQTGEEYAAHEAVFRVDRSGTGELETRHVNFVFQPTRDPDGAITGVFVHGVDVTDAVEALAAVKESEARYRELADAMPQVVWTTDASGVGQFRNRKAAAYTGISNPRLTEDEWRSIVHPDDFERVEAAWARSLRNGEPLEVELRIKRAADGEYRWHLSRALPIKNDRGEIVRWIGVATDIDELKRLSEELRQTDRRKDEFLATLAHELRNPLAPIRTGLQILKMKPTDEMAATTLEMMTRQLGMMTRLIDDLSDASRIGSGKIVIQKERMALRTAVAAALEASRQTIQQRGHELTVKLADAPVYLDADPTRISQVASNLLTNAAKYTDPGGRIELSTEHGDGEAILRVKDSGVGIAPEMLDEVFEMFSQVGSSIANSQGGLGIGLPIVKRLVELHGGRIEVKSEGLGRGAEFVVHLPLAVDGSEASEPAAAPPAGSGAKLRVLVVDDNRDSADSLARIVGMTGHEVHVAYDGNQALAEAESFRPSLALLDIGLPGLNGYEVASRIRDDPALRNTRLVAVTGWGQDEDRRLAAAAGFDLHFVKPVDPRLLKVLLESGVDAVKRELAAADAEKPRPNGPPREAAAAARQPGA